MKGDALVLFGITGDLAHKKLYGALAGLEAAGALDVPVIGVASSDWDDKRLRSEVRRKPRRAARNSATGTASAAESEPAMRES